VQQPAASHKPESTPKRITHTPKSTAIRCLNTRVFHTGYRFETGITGLNKETVRRSGVWRALERDQSRGGGRRDLAGQRVVGVIGPLPKGTQGLGMDRSRARTKIIHWRRDYSSEAWGPTLMAGCVRA
jgi:hypothetical protein